MIRISAMKWVPPFAVGQVRDHRLRWILEEVNWPYEVVLLDAPTLASPAYRAKQPFGQVPILEEEGRPVQFETGAIVLDVAHRAGMLLPTEQGARSQAVCWLVAALNSVEPALMNVAEVDFFIDDKAMQRQRRPVVEAFARKRLKDLSRALGHRDYLVDDAFSAADLMMASVLKIAASVDLLDDTPALAAYQARCFDRPAYRKAIADQCASFEHHSAEDMKFPG